MTHLFWHRRRSIVFISICFSIHFFFVVCSPLFLRLLFFFRVISFCSWRCKRKQENRKKKLFITLFTQWLAHIYSGHFVGMQERQTFHVLDEFGCLKSLTSAQTENVTNLIAEGNFSRFSLSTTHYAIPFLCSNKNTAEIKKTTRQRKTKTSSSNGFSHVNHTAAFFVSFLFLLIKFNGFKCMKKKKNSRRNEIYYL